MTLKTSLNSIPALNKSEQVVAQNVTAPGTLSGRSATLGVEKAPTSKGFSTMSKVLMCAAGAAVVATGAAYAMGYFSSESQPVVHVPSFDPTKILDLFPVPFPQYTKTSAKAFQASILINPELLFKDRPYSVITPSEMKEYFGQGATLLPDDQRTFYNRFASALNQSAFTAIENVTNSKFKADVSMMACANRENAAEYTRESGYRVFEWFAMAKDLVTHGTLSRPSCESLAKRYDYNPETIIKKAGSPNSGINFIADIISPLARQFSFENPIITSGENIITSVDNYVRGSSLTNVASSLAQNILKIGVVAAPTIAAII